MLNNKNNEVKVMPIKTVSVVVPVKNRETTIVRAVSSCIEHITNLDAVIVVDDWSTDGTVAAVLRLKSPIVEIYKNAGRGACDARNTGLNKVNSDYVVFLDSDDYYYKSLIDKLLFSNESLLHQLDVIAGVHSLEVNGALRIMKLWPQGASASELLQRTVDGVIIQCGAILWRTQFIKECGGWRSGLMQWQDVELYSRALMKSPNVLTVDSDGVAVTEYVDKKRISHNVKAEVLRTQFEAFCELSISFPMFSYTVGRLFYRHARHCYRHGFGDDGDQPLRMARTLGFKGHNGSVKHKILSTILGLSLKERISIFIKRPAYYEKH